MRIEGVARGCHDGITWDASGAKVCRVHSRTERNRWYLALLRVGVGTALKIALPRVEHKRALIVII